MRRNGNELPIIIGGLVAALVVLMFAVGCNTSVGGTVYYPHDHTHGYYDHHHHYHYYPKYGNGRVRVKPAPKVNRAPSLRKSSGFGGSRRR